MGHSIFDFSKEMTTFAMVVETPPLYKDLRDLGCKSWVFFCPLYKEIKEMCQKKIWKKCWIYGIKVVFLHIVTYKVIKKYGQSVIPAENY